MSASPMLLSPAQAARCLGVSAKALRIYEQAGLLKPARNGAGWRFYSAVDMERVRQVMALRVLGLSLGQIGAIFQGDTQRMSQALSAQEVRLGQQLQALRDGLEQVRLLRTDLEGGAMPLEAALQQLTRTPRVALDLPWPWAGERLELAALAPVTFLTGSLGSGKTRLAEALACVLPHGRFVGLNREPGGEEGDDRVEDALQWLLDDGAANGAALTGLLRAVLSGGEGARVIDLIEQDLDAVTQAALGAWLRCYNDAARPLVVMTRSSAILDLEAPGPRPTIICCLPNHSAPLVVTAGAGPLGLEAVAACLATPAVRARVQGGRARA